MRHLIGLVIKPDSDLDICLKIEKHTLHWDHNCAIHLYGKYNVEYIFVVHTSNGTTTYQKRMGSSRSYADELLTELSCKNRCS